MNKEDFNCLEICEQVRVINDLIISRGSIRQACKVIGIGKTTIRDRFKRNGYVYVSSSNLYERINNLESQEINNNKNKVICYKKKDITLFSKDLERVFPSIVELVEVKDDILSIINEYNENRKYMGNDNLVISNFKGELKVKSIKIYRCVLDRFNAFAKKNKQLKQQDIISQALWEFIEKYDK